MIYLYSGCSRSLHQWPPNKPHLLVFMPTQTVSLTRSLALSQFDINRHWQGKQGMISTFMRKLVFLKHCFLEASCHAVRKPELDYEWRETTWRKTAKTKKSSFQPQQSSQRNATTQHHSDLRLYQREQKTYPAEPGQPTGSGEMINWCPKPLSFVVCSNR